MTDPYEADVLQWSENHARLLRRYAAGHRSNDAPDWANIIVEIERPLSREVPHWRSEALRARGDAAEPFTPAMRQRIDVPALHRNALRYLPNSIDGLSPLPVAEVCSATLNELLGEA